VALADAAVAEIAGLEAAVSIREAELEEAQAELRRAEANTVQLSVAREESRIAAGELAKAEAQVAARRAALEGLEVTSPVAGVVTRIYAKPGEFCNAGAPLVLVADAARDQWIDAYVSEKDALDVYPGQAAKVRVPAGTGPYLDAKVTRVGLHTESVDSSGRSGADLGPAGYAQAEQVWVRIVPNAPLPAAPAIGTTADAIIWIR
jgi:multidrug resistance efflux pump